MQIGKYDSFLKKTNDQAKPRRRGCYEHPAIAAGVATIFFKGAKLEVIPPSPGSLPWGEKLPIGPIAWVATAVQ